MTRIVAGSLRGRRIAVPKRGTRPTTDRVREALFSSVESNLDLDQARVLDLYAGSGALGIEALSRGAGHATFVESEHKAAVLLQRNLHELGLVATLERSTVDSFLSQPADEPYDLVLADPPYALEPARLQQMAELLVRHGWIDEHSLVVIERSARATAPSWPESLVETHARTYGETAVHWLEVSE